jgi:ABC-2 type transport system ATP-binding protein
MTSMNATAPVIVEAVGLKKVFLDFWRRPKVMAVNGVDFQVRRGQILGLLGPNGSGKSTTVKMMLGLLKPTSGTLSVFNRPPSEVVTKARIGYLPEETYLYKYLTAEETLHFFGSLFKIPGPQLKKRTDDLLSMLGMRGAAKRPVGEFSKGMARRIGLAQALINDPDLIILDEPTSGLDPIGCKEVKEIIRTLASRGKTVILCSHLLADVQDVCDQVLVMYGGKIRAQGDTKDLLKVHDKTCITAPRLDERTLEQVMRIIETSGLSDETTVDTPTMTLEEFFLSVIEKARTETATNAGVEGSGKIADFLEGESDSQVTSRKILNALTEEESTRAPKSEPEPVQEPEDAGPDVDMLKKLAEPEETDQAQTTSYEDSQKDAEEKSAKNQAINDILKKK